MNNIIVISGPSGSGKSTLASKLLREFSNIGFSVSHTTREARRNEIEGEDYHFIKRPDFLKMIKDNKFIEWAEVHNNLYGTTLREIEEKTAENQQIILDIDIQGVKNLKRKIPDALYIFILPPSIEELKKRLSKRNSESPSTLNLRLKIALKEIEKINLYDYAIVNQDISFAYSTLRSIIIANNHRVDYNITRIKELFEF
jgi:guanylate kinase